MKTLFITLFISAFLYAQKIYATFNVVPAKEAHLAFNIGGVVKRTLVEIGDKVKQNELLAQLKNDDIKANLNIAKVELKYAKKDYNRQLKVKNVIGQSLLDKFAYKKEMAEAKIKQIQTTLDKTYLKAPFSGLISYKNIEVGDVVPAMNPKVVYKIISTHKRKLLVDFDEKYFNRVKIGDRFIYSIDGDTKKYQGTISKIYPVANSKTRKITAEVLANDIKVGLFGSGTILTKD